MHKPNHTATDKSKKQQHPSKNSIPRMEGKICLLGGSPPAGFSLFMQTFFLFCFQYLFSQEGAALEHYP